MDKLHDGAGVSLVNKKKKNNVYKSCSIYPTQVFSPNILDILFMEVEQFFSLCFFVLVCFWMLILIIYIKRLLEEKTIYLYFKAKQEIFEKVKGVAKKRKYKRFESGRWSIRLN